MKGRVLIVAGSDSGGGAGIEADLKTVTALGAYGATAITALTAQNTLGIDAIFPVPPEFVARAMVAVLGDIGADAIKTGMLVDAATIAAFADTRERHAPDVPLIVDPVVASSSGTRLLDPAAFDVLRQRVIARAAVVTPNVPEAEALTGLRIDNLMAMEEAADTIHRLGPRNVVVTGGHLPGPLVIDVVCEAGRLYRFEAPRIETRNTHGTGCTFASAIAAGIAQGMGIRAAIERAHLYVRAAIAAAPGLGQGRGPLNHAYMIRDDGG
jgi:hydroxymethylpyrimidine/phosphomethylpyrimidine kinase